MEHAPAGRDGSIDLKSNAVERRPKIFALRPTFAGRDQVREMEVSLTDTMHWFAVTREIGAVAGLRAGVEQLQPFGILPLGSRPAKGDVHRSEQRSSLMKRAPPDDRRPLGGISNCLARRSGFADVIGPGRDPLRPPLLVVRTVDLSADRR
ncbi:hypothetical protein [Sphingomonas sp. Leaf4]|uniref:hypothetical protein n=1 Tax=Sphingomonas sp. Leaf4 TaxID=2876553 RepID=UPI001E4111E5|nr:hypothetical protein [Sphingomonas sp. Leaf4]